MASEGFAAGKRWLLVSLFKALTDPIFDKDTYLQIYEPGNFGHLATDVALCVWIVDCVECLPRDFMFIY